MSLILGIPLSNRIYLVSDSRVTEGSSQKDNCAKWNNLNARLCVLGAGHLQFASYLIRKIRKEIKEDDSFHELEIILKQSLYNFSQDFYEQTGSYKCNVALIFGGYDPNLKRKTTTGRFGEVIGNPLVRRGDGSAMDQNVDLKYFDAMRAHFDKNTEEMLRSDVATIEK